MLYKNALIFKSGQGFVPGSFRVENGLFAQVMDSTPEEAGIDLRGRKVIPGLIDLHSHGAVGADFSDGDYSGLKRMAAHLAKQGVTAFAPTSMTLPYDVLERAFATAKQLDEERPEGHSRLMGIHMEGPFFSEKKKGAQNADYLRLPDAKAFKALNDGCGGLVKIADIAPELEGSEEFIREVSGICRVSLAHTNANYEQAKMAFSAGARHLTHLFNAMPSLLHRDPGVIGAAAERDDVVAELICDGFHVHPSAVRAAFRLFPGRICLISDALRCAGMPDGEYELGGQPVFLKGNLAHLADGTIAGSASSLYSCMLNAIAFGIPEDTAITAATLTPAKELGCDDRLGSIEEGKLADFVICGDDMHLQSVYIGGKQV